MVMEKLLSIQSLVLPLLLLLLAFSSLVSCQLDSLPSYDLTSLNRSSFPEGFVFGAATAAYQYEGAAFEAGKGLSIWDTFTHEQPWKIPDGSNGDVALDSYKRYKEDLEILDSMGMDAYRMSIPWARILPNGSLKGGKNEEAIQHYKDLFNELEAKGKKPFVTIFHWDVPQALEDEYLGFLSPQIVQDYTDYAEVLFEEFGDKVKHWITFNEPYMFTVGGYINASLAPGRGSPWQSQLNATQGDSAVEPYLVVHHILLAHASAVKVYREKYQEKQKGEIGITHVADWRIPFTQSIEDREATQRALDFNFGWFVNPIVYGDYPDVMRSIVGLRLPKFSEEESSSLIGSYDFIGINYYTSTYVINRKVPANPTEQSYFTDTNAYVLSERNGQLIGPVAGSVWLNVYPKGIRDYLIYLKEKFGNPRVFITENGISEASDPTIPVEKALIDPWRISYHFSHLDYVRAAISEGSNVQGYFVWTLLDDFEWNSGYTVRFGIGYIDFQDNLKRYKKLSHKWFTKFLKPDSDISWSDLEVTA
ncbi:beta-glucosidase 13-like [Impatiens glandulifera]|uniref:beta-glucosidase 13-like n=1 Tax=Impatiens glandulifera TaxID=253017 RepID=UPI001FB14355|nr:beta-glucosidase 13-like [Impatiens glandulifera]